MLSFVKHFKPSTFFVVAAVFLEVLLNIVTPPLQAPDEFSHFYRAFQVAEGHFLPEKTTQRLGGQMPQGMIDFADQYRNSAYIMQYTLDRAEIRNSCKITLQENDRRFQDFANTSYYSPVSYLPQALIIFVLKTFTDNVGLLYFGGRVFTFLVWLLCMFFVIKTLPIFKWLFTFLLLLPTHPYITNSFSADTVTNILSFLLISLTLKHIFVTEKLTAKHLLVLTLIIGLLVLAKVVYIGIALMLVLIPISKFNNRTQRFFTLASIFIFAFMLTVIWSGKIMEFYIPFKDYNPAFRDLACMSPVGDYYAQQNYILHHGFYFFKVIFNSLFAHPHTYLSGYIGVFGNGDIGMPTWVYIVSYFLILIVALSEKNDYSFTTIQKLIVASAAFIAYVLLLLSQHLIWDRVGEGIVDLVQGRYLVPVFPLLLLLFENKIKINKHMLRATVIVSAFMLNLYGCWLIHDRFFTGDPCEKKQFYCDAELLDTYGAFKSTDYDIFPANPNCQTDRSHRSGKFSAWISPESPYCYTCKLKNIKPGDLLEIEAWEKGKGALIVLSGEQKYCGEFYFAGTYNSYREKNGWQKIKNVYQVNLACDSLDVGLYLWNPTKTGLYIDDLKASIKKFKPGGKYKNFN